MIKKTLILLLLAPWLINAQNRPVKYNSWYADLNLGVGQLVGRYRQQSKPTSPIIYPEDKTPYLIKKIELGYRNRYWKAGAILGNFENFHSRAYSPTMIMTSAGFNLAFMETRSVFIGPNIIYGLGIDNYTNQRIPHLGFGGDLYVGRIHLAFSIQKLYAPSRDDLRADCNETMKYITLGYSFDSGLFKKKPK